MKAIRFEDIHGNDHIVNPDYIVELSYFDASSPADKDCYWKYAICIAGTPNGTTSGKVVEIDEHTYFKIIEWL